MIQVRRSQERGFADHGWLRTFHTFSFADYHDPRHMGFSTLRVINEDTIAGGGGFPTHGHRDMEIVTYVIEGALEHRDTLGNSTVIRPGEVQRMSAGSGIEHSEKNHHPDRQTHLLQIWIRTAESGITPSYEQKAFSFAPNSLTLVVAKDRRDGAIGIHQNAEIHVGKLSGSSLQKKLAPGRSAWLQIVSGSVQIQGTTLAAGDGAGLVGESLVEARSESAAEFLLLELS